jgi:hypothetical protein
VSGGNEVVFAVEYRVVSRDLVSWGAGIKMRSKGPKGKRNCMFDDSSADDDSSSEDEYGFGCFGEGSWDGLDVKLDVDSGL